MINSLKLNKIISNFEMRTRLPKTYSPKMTFLGGHDVDIASLNILLNISSSSCVEEQWRKGNTSALNCEYFPTYASSVIIELHSDDEIIFYVKVKYNGKYVYLCEKKDTKCSYSEWKSRVKNGILTNIDQLCGRKISEERKEENLDFEGIEDIENIEDVLKK